MTNRYKNRYNEPEANPKAPVPSIEEKLVERVKVNVLSIFLAFYSIMHEQGMQEIIEKERYALEEESEKEREREAE